MMDSDSEEERNKPSKNKDTEKRLFKEEGIKCNICESTFCWQSGLRAQLKSIDTGKIKFNQCELRKLIDHIIYYHWEIHEKTKCDECYRSFINTDKLEKHKCTIHPAKNTEEQLNENY